MPLHSVNEELVNTTLDFYNKTSFTPAFRAAMQDLKKKLFEAAQKGEVHYEVDLRQLSAKLSGQCGQSISPETLRDLINDYIRELWNLKADLSRADHEHAYKLDIHWLVPGPYLLQGHEA